MGRCSGEWFVRSHGDRNQNGFSRTNRTERPRVSTFRRSTSGVKVCPRAGDRPRAAKKLPVTTSPTTRSAPPPIVKAEASALCRDNVGKSARRSQLIPEGQGENLPGPV